MQEDFLFNTNLAYDSSLNKWIQTVEGSNNKFYYTQKPKWAETIENMNIILLDSPNPERTRNNYDRIYEITTKNDNPINKKTDTFELEKYLIDIYDMKTLNSLKSLFELKKIAEEKSSVLGGSMPSSSCNQMRKFTTIVKSIDNRLKNLNKLHGNNRFHNFID